MAFPKLDGITYMAMIRAGMKNLAGNVRLINDLNVFPIPDGDTGDNMLMTMKGGSAAFSKATPHLGNTAKNVADGMLLGARGNSGVILSQFFAGIAKGFKNLESADGAEITAAFRQGVKQAYDSVMSPTEGTILTVAREATEFAASACCKDLAAFLSNFIMEARVSLGRTPSLLPVLKEAGVVDSGGAGLVYIIEGMQLYLMGMISLEDENDAASSSSLIQDISGEELNLDLFGPDTRLEFGYCTETLLRLQNIKCDISSFDLAGFKDAVSKLGDSIVCTQNGSIVKLHVHTMEPYKVLEICQKYGEFLTVKIENMMLQHSSSSDNSKPQKAEKERQKYAIVCVSNGLGISRDFKSFGASEVINGGQTMNPSSEDFIKAFDRADAEDIFVLPNNGNIILAARQAASMYTSSNVHVIPTKTIGDAYAILPMTDLSLPSPEEIEDSMLFAMEGTVTAEISRSTRDTSMCGLEIKKNDYFGIIGKEIVTSDLALTDAARYTLEKMDLKEHGLIVIIRGKDASAEESEDIITYLKRNYPLLEISETYGMQDVYPFIFVAE